MSEVGRRSPPRAPVVPQTANAAGRMMFGIVAL